MAEIVFGLGASHTPQVNTGPEVWSRHALRDRTNKHYLPDGSPITYDELAQRAPDLSAELTPEAFAAKSARCEQAIGTLRDALAASGADVAVVIGDDQRELFQDELIPCFAIFTGPTVIDRPDARTREGSLPPGLVEAQWAFHADSDDVYQVDAELATHLAVRSMQQGFDVASATSQYPGRTLGHAFTYPKRRFFPDTPRPVVPVFVNTYYPPNRPAAPRCYAFGRALGAAIRDWRTDRTVAVIATGGLSHFVLDEAFDRQILDFLAAPDERTLADIPDARFTGGTAEALNWITLAGIVGSELKYETVDYVAGYRSPAGTGVGLTFARWS